MVFDSSLLVWFLAFCCSSATAFSILPIKPSRRTIHYGLADDDGSSEIAEISNEAQEAIDSSSSTKFLTSWRVEGDSSTESIGGSFLLFSSLALFQSGNVVDSGLIGFGAATLSATKGMPGNSFRFVGSAAWNVGCRIKNLSKGAVRCNAKLLGRESDLIDGKLPKALSQTERETPGFGDRAIGNLEELREHVYASYDYANNELSVLESTTMKANRKLKNEIDLLKDDLEEILND